MIRPLLLEALGHVVHARMSMESLKAAILEEMEAGYRPTTRGHEWQRETYDDLHSAAQAIELAFHYLKAVQWPEVRYSRINDAALVLEQLDGAHHETADHAEGGAELAPSDNGGHPLEDGLHVIAELH